jgi:hypothetical protein
MPLTVIYNLQTNLSRRDRRVIQTMAMPAEHVQRKLETLPIAIHDSWPPPPRTVVICMKIEYGIAEEVEARFN